MKTIKLIEQTGDFAENKDIARYLRINHIEPEIAKNKKVVLDFEGVNSATQSFIHALISQVIRDNGEDVFEKLLFKNCSDRIKPLIEIVSEYVQDGINADKETEKNKKK